MSVEQQQLATVKFEPESFTAAYNRFLSNYNRLAGRGANLDWFEQHVPSLLALAVPTSVQPRQDRPIVTRWQSHNGFLNRAAFIDYYAPPELVLA